MKNQFVTGGNVTALKHYRKPMKNPILIELLDHWENLRAGRIAPLRSEIDPRKIENALEYAFILEQPQIGEARFRIAGMKLCELMGMEIRSMPAASVIAPQDRDAFNQILNGLFKKPEIVELALQTAGPGQAGPSADMLLLPMKNEAGEISRILGCLIASGNVGKPPQRFTIKARNITRIIASDSFDPKTLVTGFAEATEVFVPKSETFRPSAASSTKNRDYLRLVKT